MQTTLLTLAIAVILALLAALLGPHFVDWNAQRGNFEQQASALIGLPVRVAGSMDVRLLPSPSLVLSNIEIGKSGDAQALRAKALGIEFALPSLLSGKLRAVELRLIAPELRLSLDHDGRVMLPPALAGLNTDALSIDKLMVEDARIEMSDAASDAQLTLGKLWFKGDVRALPGPFRGEGAFVMDGGLYGYRISSARPDGAGARIKLSLDPADRPVSAEVEGLLTAERGAPRFEGNATIARRQPAVKGDKVPPSEPWRLTARVKANAAAALFEQVEYQYGPDERALKLAGTAEAKFGAHPRLDAVLTARQLDADKMLAVADGQKLTPRAAISALLSAASDSLRPPIPTQLGFGIDSLVLGGAILQDLRGDLDIGQGGATLTGFEFRAPGFTRVQAGGRIDFSDDSASFTGPVDLSSVDPRAFAEWLDGKAGAAKLPARPLRVRGELTLGPGRIAIERMNAEFDRNTFDGRLSYDAGEANGRPRFDARLRADDLDLDAWLLLLGASPSDLTRPEDVSLALTLGRLRFAGLEAGKADIALTLNSGALAIDRFSIGDFGGGSLDAKGKIDLQNQPRGGVSFELSLKDAAVLRTLAERLAPAWSDALQPAAAAAIPAKLQGKLDIEPAAGGTSRYGFTAAGPLGASRLDLNASLTGAWNNARAADISMQASLDTADVNSLIGLVSAGRVAPVARQPGRYTLALNGKPEGEMRIDTRLASANVDLRAAGTIRSLATDERSGTLDVVIGPSPATQPRLVWPGAPAGGVAVALKSALKFDPVGLRFDNMQASVGGNSVTGRLGVGFGKPTVIDGEIKAEAIDLPVLIAAATGLGVPNEKGNWSETPYSTTAWPSMIGALSVNAARATMFPAMRAANLRFGLRFTGNDIAADAIEADIFGGRLSGEATMRRGADGIGLSGRVTLRDADAAQLLSAENSAAVTGRAGIQLQLDGSGLTPRALVGSLHGSGKAVLEKGRFAALDPKAFAAAIRSVDQGLPLDASRIRDVVMRALEAGPLVVDNAEAALSVAAGVVRIESFAARSDAAELAATGSYNLADSGLDARVALRGPVTAGAPQRPELAIMLRGPVLAPQRSVDVSALTGWLALRSVDQQTRRIEAIEHGRPGEAALQTAPAEADPSSPDPAPAAPHRRSPPQAQPRTEPLPPPVEVGPAPGVRSRGPQRVEGVPQQRPAETQANPFPKPIGSPPPQTRAPIF